MSADDKENGLDLSALSFGPSWARDEQPKKDYSDYTPKEGAKSRKGGFKKTSNRASQGHGADRRSKGPRRDNNNNNRGPRFEVTPAPEGFTAEVMPVEEGLDNLAKQIQQTARTYSVFDLARLVLQSRDRFNIGLKAPKDQKLFRNFHTSATYLTKEEAVADLWNSENLSLHYQPLEQEVEAPSGNFTSVARCRKSGVFLGPPNLHDYQTKLRELHRERFSGLPFEVFQRNIEILKDEESIAAWIESEKIQTYYLPVDVASADKENQTLKKEDAVDGGDTVQPEDQSDAEPKPAVTEDSDPETTAQPADAPDPAGPTDSDKLLKSRAEVEAHFLENHFDKIYKQVQTSWVPSDIPKRLLSPGLFTLLKDTISEEKRYPGKLSSMMCRQLSGRNIAVFKLQKKLKAGPSRPHAMPPLESLSERPKQLLQWAIDNDGKGIDKLWSDLLPKDVSEEEKAQWYHDLKWLLTQGFATLMEDGQVFHSKKQENTPTKEDQTSKSKETTNKASQGNAQDAAPDTEEKTKTSAE